MNMLPSSRWRWAYSSNAFTRMTLEEAIPRIRDLGFQGIEILADAPHAWPAAMDPAACERIETLLREAGLAISNVNANTARGVRAVGKKSLLPSPPSPLPSGERGDADPGPTLLDSDPAIRETRLRHLEQSLAFTSRIGGTVMSLTSGPAPEGVKAAELDGRIDRALDRLLPLAGKLGVRLALEYEPGFFLGNAASTAAVLARFPTLSLGVNLDLGHAWCAGEDPAQSIRRFGARIYNCHLEDIRDRVHFHRIPGDGEMPWGAIKTALLQTDYRRFLTLELYTMTEDPVGAGRKGLEFLRQVFE